jgi:hypothetical protein
MTRSFATLVVLGLACGAGAYWIGVRQNPGEAIDVSPSFLELVNQPIEGESVTVPLQLTNRSSSEIVLQQIQAACSCTRVATRGGKTLKDPLPIAPGTSLPWQATINTESRSGEQEFRIHFVFLANGRRIEKPVRIRMSVLAGWRSDPYEVAWNDLAPGAGFEAEIDLYDGNPGAGLPLKDVQSSNTELIRVQSFPIDGHDGAAAYPPPFRLRRKLVVYGDAPAEYGRTFQADVLIRSDDPRVPEFRIPVRGRTRDADYRLFPRELQISASDTPAAWKRVVDCQVRSAEIPVPTEVLKKPDFLNVAILRESELLARIAIECPNAPTGDDGGTYEVVLGVGGRALVTIPVTTAR